MLMVYPNTKTKYEQFTQLFRSPHGNTRCPSPFRLLTNQTHLNLAVHEDQSEVEEGVGGEEDRIALSATLRGLCVREDSEQ